MKINKKNIYLIFTTFYIYLIMALFESSRGNFIPFFIDEFHTSNSVISLIISLNTVGSIIGSFLGGQLCEKLGHKFAFILGTTICTLAVFISPFISGIYMLAAFYFVFGIGRAILSISVDSLVPALSIGFEVILMNLTHFMYGSGSFIGQSICGKLLSYNTPWRSIYSYLGIFFAVSVILTCFMKIPNMHVIKNTNEFNKKDLYKNQLAYIFVIALSFAMVAESYINSWLISYIRNTYNYNPSEASVYASLFFLLFASGRLLGGFIINKLGDIKGLKSFMILGSICTLAGLFLKESGLIFISFSGFFISIGFPTFMVVISKSFKMNSSLAIGYIVTLSNLVSVILFYFSGILNDVLGAYASFYIVPVCLLVCFGVLNIISKKLSEEEK